jgi:hypothetical protein
MATKVVAVVLVMDIRVQAMAAQAMAVQDMAARAIVVQDTEVQDMVGQGNMAIWTAIGTRSAAGGTGPRMKFLPGLEMKMPNAAADRMKGREFTGEEDPRVIHALMKG